MGNQIIPNTIDWTDCNEDIRALDDNGNVIYSGPKWIRCAHIDCGELLTHGMIEKHQRGCVCNGRRVVAVRRLKPEEIEGLQSGKYPLTQWEHDLIHGIETKA